jgi:hypothetical protein
MPRLHALVIASTVLTAGLVLSRSGTAHAVVQEGCSQEVAQPPYWDPPPFLAVQLLSNTDYTGDCVLLHFEQRPHGGVPALGDLIVNMNDRVLSVRLGAGVRLALFEDWLFGGKKITIHADTPDFFGNKGFSSVRLEESNRSPWCDDLLDNEVAFKAPGDCYVINAYAHQPWGTCRPLYLEGLRNDSMTTIANNSDRSLTLFQHGGCAGHWFLSWPYTEVGAAGNDVSAFTVNP